MLYMHLRIRSLKFAFNLLIGFRYHELKISMVLLNYLQELKMKDLFRSLLY